jgi:hypothetical protein
MLDQVKEFRGTAAQSDDITMLALKYLASGQPPDPFDKTS